MAGKELRYRVDVDANDAVRGLKEFGKAGEKAGKDLEQAFDDTASATDKAVQAIREMATKTDTELRNTIQAADALARALGPELAAKVDTVALVGDFQKLGLTIDDVKADADQLAVAIKEVDKIHMDQVRDGIDKVGTSLDETRTSGDQSRSVLANLSGNAMQDAFGQLGGVTGSLGVAVGQLAEYAVDGNIALSNLAKVAGPMAGLSAALFLVQQYLGGIAKVDAFKKEEVDAYSESIDELGAGMGTIAAKLREAQTFQIAAGTGPFGLGFGQNIKDITGLLDRYGISIDELATVIGGSTEQQQAWFQSLVDSGVPLEEALQIIAGIKLQTEAYNSALERSALVNDVYAQSTDGIVRSMSDLRREQSEVEAAWDTLIRLQETGRLATDEGVAAWNTLRQTLGLTNEEIAEQLDSKYDQHLADQAAAADEARRAQEEYNQALSDAGVEIDNIIDEGFPELGSALQDALDVKDVDVDLQTAEANLRTNLDQLFTDTQTFIDDHGPVDWSVVLDPAASAVGFDPALAGLITEVRDGFQEGIVNAFSSGGVPAAQAFVAEFLPSLLELGMTPAQAYELLGLPADGSVEAVVEPIVDAQRAEKARAILDALAGLDDPRVARVQVGLETEQIDGDIAYIASLLLAQDLGIAVSLADIPPEDIAAAQAFLDQKTFTASLGVDPTTAQTDIDTFVETNQSLPVTKKIEADTDPAADTVGKLRDDEEADPVTLTAEADDDKAARDLDKTAKDRPSTINLGLIQAIIQGLQVSAFLDAVATKRREAQIVAKSDNAGGIAGILDAVARTRTARIDVDLRNEREAEHDLEWLARDRTADIFVRTHGTGAASRSVSGAATPTATGPAVSTATTATAASVVTPVSINVNAAVIGNRFDVERAVATATRNALRLVGRRQVLTPAGRTP